MTRTPAHVGIETRFLIRSNMIPRRRRPKFIGQPKLGPAWLVAFGLSIAGLFVVGLLVAFWRSS